MAFVVIQHAMLCGSEFLAVKKQTHTYTQQISIVEMRILDGWVLNAKDKYKWKYKG